MRDICLQLVKYRLTESWWHIAHKDTDLGTDRVALLSEFVHEFVELRNAIRIRTEKRIVICAR